jgi:hypothetical protein
MKKLMIAGLALCLVVAAAAPVVAASAWQDSRRLH